MESVGDFDFSLSISRQILLRSVFPLDGFEGCQLDRIPDELVVGYFDERVAPCHNHFELGSVAQLGVESEAPELVAGEGSRLVEEAVRDGTRHWHSERLCAEDTNLVQRHERCVHRQGHLHWQFRRDDRSHNHDYAKHQFMGFHFCQIFRSRSRYSLIHDVPRSYECKHQ